MKTILSIIFCIFTLGLVAQNVDIFKFHPQKLYFNSGVIEWEHREASRAIIVKVGLPFDGEMKRDWLIVPSNLHTYSCEFGYRYYFRSGIYIEGSVASRTYDFDNVQDFGTMKGYFYTTNSGGKTGYQVNWKRFVLDLYVGGEIGRCNGRTESFSTNLSDAEKMVAYIGELAKKLPTRANVQINQDRKVVTSEFSGFAIYKITAGFSVGFRLQK